MKVTPTAIPDVKIIEPDVFHDQRGYFFESFNLQKFCTAISRNIEFVQDNHVYSVQNVLRGLHYQSPHSQAKLIRVIHGTIFDVVVDIRSDSSFYKQWIAMELSAESRQQLWIPEGFAHGYLTLSPQAEVCYKTSDYRYASCERTIPWNDPFLAIDWPSKDPILSAKDLN